MARRDSRELGLVRGTGNSELSTYQAVRFQPQAVDTTPSAGSTLIRGLLSIGEQYYAKRADEEAQEAYLEGAVAAQLGQSAEEISANPLTRAFVYGGYNDQMYRSEQVKGSEDYNRWLQSEGRALAPDDPRVSEAIRANSNRTTNALTPGMTARARAQALMQQTKANEAMVTTHNKAHKDFLIEQYASQVLPQGNQIIKNLVAAKAAKDPVTFNTIVDEAALLYADISNNPDLPKDMREDISMQFLKAMITNDQREPIQEMMSAGLLDNLPFEMREDLDESIRASENRTRANDLSHKIGANATFEQEAFAGKRTTAEIQSYMEEGIQDGWMSIDHAMGLWKKVGNGLANTTLTRQTLEALNRRDLVGPTGLHQLGTDVPAAMSLMDKSLRESRATATQRIGTMVPIALDLGHFPKELGEMLGSSVRAIGQASSDSLVSPEAVGALNLVGSLVSAASQESPNRAGVLLAAMPEDVQGAMSHVLEQAEFGVSADEALREYWAKTQTLKDQNPARQELTKQEKAKELDQSINASFPAGFWRSLVTGTQRTQEDPATLTMLQSSVWGEAQRLSKDPANSAMSTSALLTLASGKIMERVIPVTTDGRTSPAAPLILGRGVNPQVLFGTADKVTIGQVLAEAYPPQEGLRSVYAWDAIGQRIIHKQFDEETERYTNAVTVNTDDVRELIVQRQTAALDRSITESFGKPIEVAGRVLTVDGRNSVNLPPSTALASRELIIKAAPDSVIQGSEGAEGRVLSAQFRNASDLALARANLHVGVEYVDQRAKSAIAAAVYIDGVDATERYIHAATKALDANDTAAFNKALDKVTNPVIREALRKSLPTGRTEQRRTVQRAGGFPVM